MNIICQTLTVSTQNAITTICLNNPSTKNAMTLMMIDELLSVAKQLQKSRTIRAVIIQGIGGDFCSGMDTKELNSRNNLRRVGYELVKPTPSIFQKVCVVWQSLPMPVIAVIDGACLGAGLQLALGADFRIATPNARFGLLESKWGLVPDMAVSLTAFDVPKDNLKQLAMTAKIIDAKTALGMQIISHIDDNPSQFVNQLCADIVANSPDAVLAVKRVMAFDKNSKALCREKWWQLKLIMSKNRKIAVCRAKNFKDNARNNLNAVLQEFDKRQFK